MKTDKNKGQKLFHINWRSGGYNFFCVFPFGSFHNLLNNFSRYRKTLGFEFRKNEFVIASDLERRVSPDFASDLDLWCPRQNLVAKFERTRGVPSGPAVLNIDLDLRHFFC